MTPPVVELITRNVEATLRGVQTSAGYSHNLVVERERQYGNIRRDCLAVVKQDDAARTDQQNVIEQAMEYFQRYLIELHIVEPESSTLPVDQRINFMRSDVEKALMIDYTRGGCAIDTIIRDPIADFDDEGRWKTITVVFDVQYRTVFGDPYTKRG